MYCCSMDKDNPYRKPNTGMLEQLYNQYLIHSKDECIMIRILGAKYDKEKRDYIHAVLNNNSIN